MTAVKHAVTLLLSALFIVSARPASAQDERAREHLQLALAHVIAGDTVLAFSELEKAVEAEPRFADAHYHMGRLYTHRASAVETDFRDRLRAEKALMEALRLSPNDPRYLLELARLRLKQHMRIDAERLFRRALDEAEKLGEPEVLADVHFNLGYIKELRYQTLRHRRFSPFFRGPPVGELGLMNEYEPARYGNAYLDDSGVIEGSGDADKERMVEHYRASLRFDPYHVAAAVRLMGYLLDERRLGEYLTIARRLQAAHPERPEPLLYMGLGLHAAGREDEAGEAFEAGLARLPEADRAAIENLASIMTRSAASDYLALDDETREEYNSRYWRLFDPLYLTRSNERRLEHLSRVAYADLRFSAPETGLRGWETDPGIIYVRYGPPLEIATFGVSTTDGGNPYAVGRRSIIWSYGESGPLFIFRQMPGYLSTRFAGDYHFIAENYRQVAPALYENIPSLPELLDLPVQVARFRGKATDEIALEIHAAIPLVDLAEDLDLRQGEIETGVFLLDREGETIIERVKSELLRYAESPEVNEFRSWRIITPPGGPIVVAVEARDAVTWRAAASRDTITAEEFPNDSINLSDILVADAIRPLTEEPASRFDFEIFPNAALEFRPGEAVHIYYEVYGLQQDEEGFASYDVSLQVRVKQLKRGGGIAALIGAIADAWGFSIVGDDRLELRYGREVKLDGRDRVTEYLSLDPREVPEGVYEIRLRVWDRLGEQMARSRRAFQVVKEAEKE